MTTVQARIDENLKLQADYIFKSMGMNISTAINIFFQQVVNQKKLPFEIVAGDIPNAETIQAMQDTLNNKNLHGPFKSVDDMLEDLDA